MAISLKAAQRLSAFVSSLSGRAAGFRYGLRRDAIRRRQAADSLLAIADRVAAAGIEPMSMDEIDAEVKAVRESRKAR